MNLSGRYLQTRLQLSGFHFNTFTCKVLARNEVSTMKTLIVADDLTGALDSAVTFAGIGLRCTVARRPADIPAAMATAPDVLAVSTASREGSPDAATCAVSHVFDAIGDRPMLVFKKVDSRLKGHCAAELGMVAARTGIERAVVTPAIPAQGRATQGGQLSGAGVASPIDVTAIFAGAGVRVEVPDAATDADLDRVVAAAMCGDPVLLVGAAGLAAALARHLRPGARPAPVRNLPAPLLLAIGSRDPITLAQLDALRTTGVGELPAPDGRVDVPTGGLVDDALILRLVAGSDPFDPKRANALFAASISEIARSANVGTILACGGETADAILGSLGVGILEVEGEALPGVPVSSMVADGRRARLVTKSGGFGAPDALARIVTMTADTGRD
jgi:D-threonate/D-erythronate kinase